MKHPLRFVLPVLLGLAPLGAQSPAPGTRLMPVAAATQGPAARSVWDGVFSPEQIVRGKKAYNSECARCHGENLLGGEDSPALVDKNFLKEWNGKSVGSLVEYTREEMPSDGPGKLSRKLCTDITVFVLSANGFPAGKSDLGSDLDLLDQIIIEPKK